MSRRGARGRDRGSFTAELAVALPAVVLLLLVGLTAVVAVTTKLQCLDAAREAALAASRGESVAGSGHAPAGADVSVSIDGDRATATVRSPVPVLGKHLPRLSVSATAVAAMEPAQP